MNRVPYYLMGQEQNVCWNRSQLRLFIPPMQIVARELTDAAALQSVLESAPDYAYRVTGYPPGFADAQSTLLTLPEGKTYEDKFVYGIYDGELMLGCAELIRAYPDPETALIGLLLIADRYQSQGIGTLAYQRLEEIIRNWKGIKQIRIGVVRTNAIVLPFWQKMGFIETGEIKPYRYDKLESETIVLHKQLIPAVF